MTKSDFKKELSYVFDDNLHTKVWHNVLDWIIISLIMVSTIEVFLSTFETINVRYGHVLHFIDVFTTVFFSIEVALRIWAADQLSPKYKGVWGRIRYCFSFYGMIDILSTYTFYIALIFPLPYLALKTLRVARLLRVFRYMKSFRLLTKAFESKKKELGISLQFLSIITLILAFLLYFVENSAQPEVFDNGWKSVLWAFSQYIGDPGNFADYQPITFIGRLISTCIGILGIAIFAVPAGLVGSGFLEAVNADIHNKEIVENTEKLHLAFERKLDKSTGYQITPMNLSIPEIIARMNMNESEIIEAVKCSNDFRIINLASTIPVDQHPSDKLAIEHYIVNRPYGCFIDRASKITIVSPSNIVDPVIGHFSYYLAKMGGFNYISREIGATRPYKSYYLNSYGGNVPGFDQYMADLEVLTKEEGSWVVTLIAASGQNEPEYSTQIHLGYGNSKGDASLASSTSLLCDKDCAERLFSDIESTMDAEFNIKTERQQYHSTASPKIFLRHLSNIKDINGLMIRLAWSCTAWDSRRMLIAKTLADVIHRNILPGVTRVEDPELKKKDIGYCDYIN
ncbi:MAG: ion transporter [Bacteroidales bacterium]|nr:ion transporter [Bacteroidales bacterium]